MERRQQSDIILVVNDQVVTAVGCRRQSFFMFVARKATEQIRSRSSRSPAARYPRMNQSEENGDRSHFPILSFGTDLEYLLDKVWQLWALRLSSRPTDMYPEELETFISQSH